MADRRERDLVTLFTKALRKLGEAGHPEEASTLAGQAWWALKDSDPRGAERVNGTMHYLATLPSTTAVTGDLLDEHGQDEQTRDS